MTSAEFYGAKIISPPPDWEPGETICTPLYVEFKTISSGDVFLPTMKSIWVPSPEERAAIAAGANISLVIVGVAHPPVQMVLADTEVLDENPFEDWKER
jgi:hypothetical protein